ncbi:MAG: 16S rRNA (cytosine(967)-C(5))-methyltransferase RsmB [Lachnospiraceae bacterium]
MAAENTREIVLDMLLAVEREEEYSHRIIRDVLAKYDYLPGQEKAFIKRLFEGTLERRIELDFDINQISSVPVKKMKPLIRNLLRMSTYQILYMDSVPDAAAVSEAVKLAGKRKFQNLKGFVNGVLRKMSVNKGSLVLPNEEKEPEQFLTVTFSMPEWIVKHFLSLYSYEETKRILAGLLCVRPVTVRFAASLSAQEKEALLEKIKEKGIAMRRHPYVEQAYYLENCDNIAYIPGFAEGKLTVQDASSMLAVAAAGIRPGDTVLDVCAAPGGKTMLAAEYAGQEGRVEARDVSDYKVAQIEENISRMGLTNVSVRVWDATVQDKEAVESADVVLADVPCSGLGVMGKKRDIKYRQKPEALESIVSLQKEILKQVSSYVKQGGVLLYSTCTINPGENEEMVQWICEELGFVKEPLTEYLPKGLPCQDTAREGYLQLLPGIHDTDGFFFARLRRLV